MGFSSWAICPPARRRGFLPGVGPPQIVPPSKKKPTASISVGQQDSTLARTSPRPPQEGCLDPLRLRCHAHPCFSAKIINPKPIREASEFAAETQDMITKSLQNLITVILRMPALLQASSSHACTHQLQQYRLQRLNSGLDAECPAVDCPGCGGVAERARRKGDSTVVPTVGRATIGLAPV